jgi:ferritin-like metal-binding protein YciE
MRRDEEGFMFDSIETPRELFAHKLGAALKMENTILGMLGNLEDEAQRPELKQQLHHHAEETRRQVRNLEAAFAAIGQEPKEKPCPTVEGLEKEGKANIKLADERLVDSVILGGAAETEHHEIAVYENLITQAEALDEQDIVALLQENLEQEQHTLQKVTQEAAKIARQMVGTTA